MVKWACVTAQTRTEEDFGLLSKLLEALGFGRKEVEEYPHLRLQPFSPSTSILEVVHRKTRRTYPDLEIMISDPDSAVDVVKKMGLDIVDDQSGPEPRHSVRSFAVRLPGGTTVSVTGIRTSVAEERANTGIQGNLNAKGKRFGIVVSRFNSFITERLLAGAIDGFIRCGGADDIDIVRVPGSFEIPSAARSLAETKKYDAIICLGCLLRGDTAHYDVIVNEVTRGIGQSAQETGVPHAFGVLTCDTLEQAIDRAGLKMGNKGFEAALAAVEMASLKKAISTQQSAVSKKVVGRRSLVVGKQGGRAPGAGGRKTKQTVRKAVGRRSRGAGSRKTKKTSRK
jgi:6,7-dimethyl-8-ribityllumazine synthase